MKAIMVRKACGVKDWHKIVEEYNFTPSEVVIEKTVELNEDAFKDLCEDFFKYRDYIKENLTHMYMGDAVWHCVLVKSPKSKIGILIESEGYEYARYTSIIDISEVQNG